MGPGYSTNNLILVVSLLKKIAKLLLIFSGPDLRPADQGLSAFLRGDLAQPARRLLRLQRDQGQGVRPALQRRRRHQGGRARLRGGHGKLQDKGEDGDVKGAVKSAVKKNGGNFFQVLILRL